MKPAPICDVIRHIRPFTIKRKQAHVAALIKIEKQTNGRTKRLSELEALAFSICFPQLKRESRNARSIIH